MCCFSPVAAPASLLARLFGPIFGLGRRRVHVSRTSIYARLEPTGTQLLAYSMQLSVAGEVAMILPLPVVPGGDEDAVSFLSLADHPRLFPDLEELFEFQPVAAARGMQPQGLPKSRRLRLVVHDVGAFEASYVPTRHDFDRLDERFRLDDGIWDRLGDYADYGFAVFRLAPGRAQHIHPMAFRFRTRDRARLFFPTVHVHDGKVRPTARFDHSLYYQAENLQKKDEQFVLASGHPMENGDVLSFGTPARDANGLLVPRVAVARRQLQGTLPNRDTWIDLPAA